MLSGSASAEFDDEGKGDVGGNRGRRLRGVKPLGAYRAFARRIGNIELLGRAEPLEARDPGDAVTVRRPRDAQLSTFSGDARSVKTYATTS
jgi:hypothetical protein